MSARRRTSLRVLVILFLVLLVAQFELGIGVNLSNPPEIAPVSFAGISQALNQAGIGALVHGSLGGILGLISIVNLVIALGSRQRSVQVVGALSFLTTVLTGTNGLLFVMSGFQNDGYSAGMATGFILTFSLVFLELYFLRSGAKMHEA